MEQRMTDGMTHKTVYGQSYIENSVRKSEIFEGLTVYLKRNLEMQKKHPGKLIYTFLDLDNVDMAMVMDYLGNVNDIYTDYTESCNPSHTLDTLIASRVKISNCELDCYDGSAPIEGTLDDEPRLQMRVSFWQVERYYSRFKSLPFADMFTEVVHKIDCGDFLCQYFIDCGCDVELMAAIYTLVLNKVYGVQNSDVRMENFSTTMFPLDAITGKIDDKAGLHAELLQYGIAKFKIIPYISSKMLIPKNVLKEVKTLIDEFNKLYSEKARVKFCLDENERQLTHIILNPIEPKHSCFLSYFFKYFKMYMLNEKIHKFEDRIYDMTKLKWME